MCDRRIRHFYKTLTIYIAGKREREGGGGGGEREGREREMILTGCLDAEVLLLAERDEVPVEISFDGLEVVVI